MKPIYNHKPDDVLDRTINETELRQLYDILVLRSKYSPGIYPAFELTLAEWNSDYKEVYYTHFPGVTIPKFDPTVKRFKEGRRSTKSYNLLEGRKKSTAGTPVMIHNVEYASIATAARSLNVDPAALRYRANKEGPKYNDYYYIEESEEDK